MGLFDSIKKGIADLLGKAKDEAVETAVDAAKDKANEAIDNAKDAAREKAEERKQEKEAAAMRDALEVGDEITTIGGIIGEIVSMKEDTVTIETSKAGTKIRFLKTAIRSVDVRASEKNAPAPTETDSENK